MLHRCIYSSNVTFYFLTSAGSYHVSGGPDGDRPAYRVLLDCPGDVHSGGTLQVYQICVQPRAHTFHLSLQGWGTRHCPRSPISHEDRPSWWSCRQDANQGQIYIGLMGSCYSAISIVLWFKIMSCFSFILLLNNQNECSWKRLQYVCINCFISKAETDNM